MSLTSDEELQTSIVGDGAAKHLETKEGVWINQAGQWHSSSLYPRARKALLSLLKEEDLPHKRLFPRTIQKVYLKLTNNSYFTKENYI
jgi:hypothetical protein